MLHQLFGTFALMWASIIAVPVAVIVTAVIFWCYRWSIVQKVVMPGADECRLIERYLAQGLSGDAELTPDERAALAQLSHGVLLRNGMNAIAVAIVFLAVFTGAHALLAAL